VIAPSNPLVSIGPILAVPGIRRALARRRVRTAAVSPLVGGRAVRARSIACCTASGSRSHPRHRPPLRGLVGLLVLDHVDRAWAPRVEALGCAPGDRHAHALAAHAARLAGVVLRALGG